jgi:hypothetical protein
MAVDGTVFFPIDELAPGFLYTKKKVTKNN